MSATSRPVPTVRCNLRPPDVVSDTELLYDVRRLSRVNAKPMVTSMPAIRTVIEIEPPVAGSELGAAAADWTAGGIGTSIGSTTGGVASGAGSTTTGGVASGSGSTAGGSVGRAI